MAYKSKFKLSSAIVAASLVSGVSAHADQVFADDVIVDGSLCVGIDCVNGESFGFDTIRLKENNLRIKFDDTSSSASFPNRDWELTANDSSNGGDNRFSIRDVTGSRDIFTVFAGAPNNALVVDAQGDLGIGESDPVVELHVSDGDTPTLRLEQDGSSGFGTQTWDVAGNETNFFVRDTTNGSQLPFKILPGADSDSLVIGDTNDVGIGTRTPETALHLKRTGAANDVELRMTNDDAGDEVRLQMDVSAELFKINFEGTGGAEFQVRKNGEVEVNRGNLEINAGDVIASGRFFSNGTELNVPDYVFAPDYELMPLAEVSAFITANSHLPNVPSAADVNANGLDLTQMQLTLLEKVEELTLYTLQQQEEIAVLREKLDSLSE